MRVPTATELLSTPVVQEALDAAWKDSLPNEAAVRHEEGGWIYMDLSSGEITISRAPAGRQAEIDLSQPSIVDGSVVVGKFHTHPNPTADGWEPGPSEADANIDAIHGVP